MVIKGCERYTFQVKTHFKHMASEGNNVRCDVRRKQGKVWRQKETKLGIA